MRNVFRCFLPAAVALCWGAPLLLARVSDQDPFTGLDRLERDAVVRAVVERNPSIEAARLAWETASERESQRASLDDPTLTYGLAPASIGAGDAGVRYGQVVGVSQRLPYPGKRDLRRQIARAEAEAARGDYEAVRLRLATMASLLFDDYYLVARALEINAEHVRLLDDFQRIATARYAAGLASQQDPLQAEVEAAHLLHRDVVLRTRRRTAAAQLNALLHRAPDASLPPPPPALEVEAPALRTDVSEADVADALDARPEMKSQMAEIEARAAAVRLRDKDFYPDFELTTAFNSMWASSEHRWTVGIGVEVPLQRDRLRAASAQAELALEQAERARAAIEDTVRAEIFVARERLVEAEHVLELYRSRLLPTSEDQIRAARAGFETGQNSFIALIEAERNQRSVRLGYEEALTDLYRRRAELDRALGRLPFSK